MLLVFRELLRCQSASETARRLALSQSAISHSLARLRELFDDELFTRRPHGLVPTRKALDLAPRIEELLEAMAVTLGGSGFDPAISERHFLYSAPEYFTTRIGVSLTNLFRRETPNASFWCLYQPQQEAFAAMRRGQLDLAVGRFDAEIPRDVVVTPLYRERYRVVVRRDHPVSSKSRISEKSMREDLAYIFAGSQSELTVAETEADYSALNIVGVVPLWLTALTIVSSTDMATICPMGLAQQLAEPLRLRVMKSPMGDFAFDVSVARRRTQRDPAVAWFADAIKRASVLCGNQRAVTLPIDTPQQHPDSEPEK